MLKASLAIIAALTLGSATAGNCWTGPNGQRGCCSHHGGVCGCMGNGSKKCCDGTPSPSCMC
jgi:hypothetical protein